MKKLTDLLHENHKLKQELKASQTRADELYDRLKALDDAFYAYRAK